MNLEVKLFLSQGLITQKEHLVYFLWIWMKVYKKKILKVALRYLSKNVGWNIWE